MRPEVGWMNVVNALEYGKYDFTLRPDARRFECGSYNLAGILALGAMLELLLEVGIGRIWERVQGLNAVLVEGLVAKGYRLVSPRREESECSGIVSFTSPRHSHEEILKDLERRRMIIALREGRLRVSPHFYNSESQIAALLDALPLN
jgi:selenocysteine lyase/cysteine desulfurase